MTNKTTLVSLRRVPLNINYQQVAETFRELNSGDILEVVSIPRKEEVKKYQVSLRNALIRRGFKRDQFRTSVDSELMLRVVMR